MFPGGDMGGDREAGVVIDELEDHAFTAAGEDVLGRVQLPQTVMMEVVVLRCGSGTD
jgi:hypothetical protein